MKVEEELRILGARLLISVRHNKDLNVRGVKVLPSKYSLLEGIPADPGQILLDNQTTATFLGGVILEINFNNRYDFIIRYILNVLEVELHKFGSIWIGYPNPEPLLIKGSDISTSAIKFPEEIIAAQEAEERRLAKQKKIMDEWGLKDYTLPTISWAPTLTSGTSIPSRTYYTGGGISEIRGIYNISSRGEAPQFIWSTSTPAPAYQPPANANPPRDPSIARALKSGISQREIDRLRRTGRLYGR